jgi:flagellar hook protein FlgE
MVAYSLFSSSVAAMAAQSVAFENIGNNITNLTTPGYKAGQVRFQEIVGGKNSGGTFNNLLGTQPHQQIFRDREGVVINSNRRLDAALSGEGFFVTSTSQTPQDDTLELTDAGRFSETLIMNGTDEEVYLTDIKGNFLLGWPFDPTTNTFQIDTASTGSLQPIRVDQTGNVFDAVPTSVAELMINLPASATAGDTFEYNIPILDGTGDADGVNDNRGLTTSFTRNAATNTWDLTLSGAGATVTTPAAQPVQIVFNADGSLATVNGATTPLDVTIDWTNPAVTTNFTLDLNGSTQFADQSTLIDLRTDGNTDGVLSEVVFGRDGNVLGQFSNGLNRPLARVAVADVIEPNRLLDAGETHYRLGPESGDLMLIDLENTSRVFFTGQALEESTVDVGIEFTNLIITQRAYSSAATSLRTVDEMVRTATELKS